MADAPSAPGIVVCFGEPGSCTALEAVLAGLSPAPQVECYTSASAAQSRLTWLQSRAVSYVSWLRIRAAPRAVLVVKLGAADDAARELAKWSTKHAPSVRIVCLSWTAATVASSRRAILRAGAVVVSQHESFVAEWIGAYLTPASSNAIACNVCGVATEAAGAASGSPESINALRRHYARYHGDRPMDAPSSVCPLCNKSERNITFHIYEDHNPGAAEKSVRGYAFSVVIVRRPDTGEFLLCNEFCSQGWWCPAGRVDEGEGFREAAIRECVEEAGVHVKLTGLLQLEYNSRTGQKRAIFVGEPVDVNETPKTEPDYESQEARWFPIDRIRTLEMRSRHELVYYEGVHAGTLPIYPLEVLRTS